MGWKGPAKSCGTSASSTSRTRPSGAIVFPSIIYMETGVGHVPDALVLAYPDIL